MSKNKIVLRREADRGRKVKGREKKEDPKEGEKDLCLTKLMRKAFSNLRRKLSNNAKHLKSRR